MKMRSILLLLLFAAGCSTSAQHFQAENIRKHVQTLADDSMEGRGTGTPGEQAASEYIVAAFKDIGLTSAGDDNTFLQAFPFRQGVHGQGESGASANVVGYLDNNAPNTIIIGAHYDHLGMDGQLSSLDANPKNKIHNGADDNASGVAGVIELARYFATNTVRENNNFLFVCFSGEELGLLGSKYFADHYDDLSQTNFMINLDMIGRLDPQTRTVVVYGTGTSPEFEPLLKRLETESLKIKTDSSGTGPSDHTSFYLKNIPVLHFFTGGHGDYHKPSDDWEKVDIQGEIAVLRLIVDVIENLDGKPKQAFLKTRTMTQTARTPFKVTLGIMPSYASAEEGLKVDGVTEGRPAHQAGIQTGDVIIQMGDLQVKDIQQYMDALSKFEKGQTIPVKVKRGNEVVEVSVTF